MLPCQDIAQPVDHDHEPASSNKASRGTGMDPAGKPGGPPANTSPNQGDYDELLCIYDPGTAGQTLSTKTHSCTGTGHLDSFTTVGQVTKMPPAMTMVEYSEPNQWGKLVSGSRESGASTYDLD